MHTRHPRQLCAPTVTSGGRTQTQSCVRILLAMLCISPVVTVSHLMKRSLIFAVDSADRSPSLRSITDQLGEFSSAGYILDYFMLGCFLD